MALADQAKLSLGKAKGKKDRLTLPAEGLKPLPSTPTPKPPSALNPPPLYTPGKPDAPPVQLPGMVPKPGNNAPLPDLKRGAPPVSGILKKRVKIRPPKGMKPAKPYAPQPDNPSQPIPGSPGTPEYVPPSEAFNPNRRPVST